MNSPLTTLLFIEANDNSFLFDLQNIYIDADVNTREHFRVDEPIFRESYYTLGDANETKLLQFAQELGYDDIGELFADMNEYHDTLMQEYAQYYLDKINVDFYANHKFYKQIKFNDAGNEIEHELDSCYKEIYTNYDQLRCYEIPLKEY